MTERDPGRPPSGTAPAIEFEAWAGWNVPRWLAGVKPVVPGAAPQAVLVLGQPGAGKGPVTDTVCRWFATQGQCVVIDPNELLYLHPDYARLAEQDLASATTTLRPLARRLASELLDAAVRGRTNIVLDGPGAVPARVAEVARRLKDNGYAVTALVLAIAPEESWRAVLARQERHVQEFGFPRQCDRAAHDAASRSLPDVLDALDQPGLTDELHVLTPTGQLLFSRDVGAGAAPGAARAALPPQLLAMSTPAGGITPAPRAGPAAPRDAPAPPGIGHRPIVVAAPPRRANSSKPATPAEPAPDANGDSAAPFDAPGDDGYVPRADQGPTPDADPGPDMEPGLDPATARRRGWQMAIREKAKSLHPPLPDVPQPPSDPGTTE